MPQAQCERSSTRDLVNHLIVDTELFLLARLTAVFQSIQTRIDFEEDDLLTTGEPNAEIGNIRDISCSSLKALLEQQRLIHLL